MAAKESGFRVVEVRLEMPIAAPPRKVWAGLTRSIGKWWPKEFRSRRDTKRFVVEPRVGGRVYEDAGGGEGLLWYTVIGVEAPKRLVLAGELFPSYGGPAGLQTTFTLEPDGPGTLVKLEEIVHGRVSEKTERNLGEGWELLLGRHLRGWAERARTGRARATAPARPPRRG